MRRLMLAVTVAGTASALWLGSASAAAMPATASCEGVVASLAAHQAPGRSPTSRTCFSSTPPTRAFRRELLNLAFAQTEGHLRILNDRAEAARHTASRLSPLEPRWPFAVPGLLETA